ncbi:HAD-IA family hydrolase [Streptacidiphilus sp. N1-3]|uniref:HAD-IA family hydrolase n=1 Tax=Streptacidiphilus alkalitolerans TaxID=3342712 RepID=A0ABV6XAR2_9ACTN
MTTLTRRPNHRWAVVDFNGVLGRHPTHEHWSALAKASVWGGSTGELQQAFWAQRAVYDAGKITEREFWRPLAGPGAALDQVADQDAAMWLEIDPQVLDALNNAVDDGIRLVMLSNAPRPVADLITAAPWSGLFAHLLYSCDLGLNKPARGAYWAALAAAGNPDPADVLFVDDRIDNIASARQMGLLTHHYQGHPENLAANLHLHAGRNLQRHHRLNIVSDPT